MQLWQLLAILLSLIFSIGGLFYWWQKNSNSARNAMLTLVRHMPDPVFVVNKQGRIVAYSPAACQLFEYSPEEIINLSIEALIPGDMSAKHRQLREGFMTTRRGQAMDNEVVCINKLGEKIPVVTRVRTFELDGEHYAYVSVHDIREFKSREAFLKNLSEEDPLTGLANRRLFDHDASREWQRAARNNQPITLLMIDIDFFKQYNDYYGHPAGDTCLKKVADIIQSVIQRGTDCVARYGGEEFICLLPNIDATKGMIIAEQILQAVQAENIVHQQSNINQRVTVSIGVATTLPQQTEDLSLGIAQADAALYCAKTAGRNCIKTAKDLVG